MHLAAAQDSCYSRHPAGEALNDSSTHVNAAGGTQSLCLLLPQSIQHGTVQPNRADLPWNPHPPESW
jgi:hypothetical protein